MDSDGQFENINRKDLLEIIRVGLCAVSPYNAQPWEFEFRDGCLYIFTRHNDRGFWKYKNVIFYSLGAFLENLSEGAKHLHYEIFFEHTQEFNMNMTRPVCEVRFRKVADTGPYDVRHVLSRCTNRKIYRPDPVPASVLELCKNFNGPARGFIDVTGLRSLAEHCCLIENFRLINDQLRDELADVISYDAKQAGERRWGLDLRTVDLPPVALWYMRLNRNRFIRGTVGKSGLVQKVTAKLNLKLYEHTSLLAAFKETDNSPKALVEDWMWIQKLLNEFERLGLSSHIIEMPIDIARMDESFLKPAELKQVRYHEAAIEKETGIKLSSLLTLVRAGYADPCPFKSLRREPESFFTA